MASQNINLTRTPLEIKAAASLAAGSYRVQVPKRANYEVLLWEGDDPPGGNEAYSLGPGENLALEIGADDFHMWIFSDRRSVEVGVVHIITGTV